jgi:Recombinase
VADASTGIRSILKNEVYLGRSIWGKTDYSEKPENGGGGAKLRKRSEWVVAEGAHEAIIEQETCDAAQARFQQRARTQRQREGHRAYPLSGFVRCASGHQPYAMFGRKRTVAGTEYVYHCCAYGKTYGKAAAEEIGHPSWLNAREDQLLDLTMEFFAERLFHPLRVERLEQQLRSQENLQGAEAKRQAKKLREQIAEADRARWPRRCAPWRSESTRT